MTSYKDMYADSIADALEKADIELLARLLTEHTSESSKKRKLCDMVWENLPPLPSPAFLEKLES